jgi:hypothetical protein
MEVLEFFNRKRLIGGTSNKKGAARGIGCTNQPINELTH